MPCRNAIRCSLPPLMSPRCSRRHATEVSVVAAPLCAITMSPMSSRQHAARRRRGIRRTPINDTRGARGASAHVASIQHNYVDITMPSAPARQRYKACCGGGRRRRRAAHSQDTALAHTRVIYARSCCLTTSYYDTSATAAASDGQPRALLYTVPKRSIRSFRVRGITRREDTR